MSWSQILGLGVLVLMAALGFWLMSGGKKVKPSGRQDTESTLGERELLRHGGDSGPGSGD